MKKRFVTKFHQIPCPECGNTKEFDAISSQSAEDYCNVWVQCGECGYDPTSNDTGARIEDVWGDIGRESIPGIFSCCWTGLVS